MAEPTTDPTDGTWEPIFTVHASKDPTLRGGIYLLTFADNPPFLLGDGDDRYSELAHIIDSTAEEAPNA